MSLKKIQEKNLEFILFGGKGGVGKTTMAAVAAIHFAKTKKIERKGVLILTTDPAPSLADSFGQKLENQPTEVKEVKNLFAMEINAGEVLKEFKKEYGEEILDILQKGTYLSEKETEEMFSLDIPGLDEVMGLKKITDFMDSEEFDLYVVDTAPTGHTLRLLALPELLDNWIKFLAGLRWRYRYITGRIVQKEVSDKVDKFLLEMKRTIKKVRTLLQDPRKTEFIIVTIPEAMGLLETKDLVNELESLHVPAGHIIINNVVPEDKSDFMRFRRKQQEKYIEEMKEIFKSFEISEVNLRPTDIHGVKALEKLEEALF